MPIGMESGAELIPLWAKEANITESAFLKKDRNQVRELVGSVTG